MDRKILHNLKDTPFNERETFNNAILLLSMVKSEYYYIVGFSRPDNRIEIGFDFEDKVYGQISETVMMDFSVNLSKIRVFARLTNIIFEGKAVIPFAHKDNFTIEDDSIVYDRLFEKDDTIPVSIDKLNLIILSIKKDIEEFINSSIAYLTKKIWKNNENNTKHL